MVWGQRLPNSCPCAPKWLNLAITCDRVMYEWGNTQEWWEGGDVVVWSVFHRVRHGRRAIWRAARQICCRVYVAYGTECVGIKTKKAWTFDARKL